MSEVSFRKFSLLSYVQSECLHTKILIAWKNFETLLYSGKNYSNYKIQIFISTSICLRWVEGFIHIYQTELNKKLLEVQREREVAISNKF